MFDHINIDTDTKRASVEYAKARANIDTTGGTSRVHRRDARMKVVEVLRGVLEHRNGHTIVVFPDKSEAKF